ncbi:MAG: (Fe-S)-binding protein [Candidatus Odinarchaeota archaeon]
MANYTDQIHRCFRCGYCKFPGDFNGYNCPSYARFRFESYSTGGRLWLVHAWQNGEVEWSKHLAEILFSCVTCKNCVEQCPMRFSDDIVDWIIEARGDMIEKGQVLPQVNEFLGNIYETGNPWGLLEARDKWARNVKRYSDGDKYLFYVGCAGSYDPRGQKAAKALASLLDRLGVSYGILGSEEVCDGNEVHALGETGLFKELAGKNVETFKKHGVRKMVTLSPHSYNIMRNKYLGFGAIEVIHYTQLLSKLIKENKMDLPTTNAKVTYHDPCYLGRHNGEYEAPREILKSIPGIKIAEMERNRENAFCCGGGSGNFVFDLLGRSGESPSRIRIREAHKTGAEYLITTCPSCKIMLDDALNAEGLEKELAVVDLSEFVVRILK